MLVDAQDIALFERNWYLHSAGYAAARIEGKIVYAHRLLLGLISGDGRQADHRNGDRLDNRRLNLRIASPQINSANRAAVEGRGNSPYRGVSRFRNGRWRAYCSPEGKQRHLGYFATEEEAAEAVAKFRAEHLPSERETVSGSR